MKALLVISALVAVSSACVDLEGEREEMDRLGEESYLNSPEAQQARQKEALNVRLAKLEAALETQDKLIKSQNAKLEAQARLLEGVHRTEYGDMVFTGMNLVVQSGSALLNGKGNLVLGYNRITNGRRVDRVGSHNLVIGDGHSYAGSNAIVSGHNNFSAASYASVLGGSGNVNSSIDSVLVGGRNNAIHGAVENATLTGGYDRQISASHLSYTTILGMSDSAWMPSNSSAGQCSLTRAPDSREKAGR